MLKLDSQTVGGVCNSLNALEGVYHSEKTSLPIHLRQAQELIWLLWDSYLKAKDLPSERQLRAFAELKNMSPDEYLNSLLMEKEKTDAEN